MSHTFALKASTRFVSLYRPDMLYGPCDTKSQIVKENEMTTNKYTESGVITEGSVFRTKGFWQTRYVFAARVHIMDAGTREVKIDPKEYVVNHYYCAYRPRHIKTRTSLQDDSLFRRFGKELQHRIASVKREIKT